MAFIQDNCLSYEDEWNFPYLSYLLWSGISMGTERRLAILDSVMPLRDKNKTVSQLHSLYLACPFKDLQLEYI